MIRKRSFDGSELILVAPAPPPDNPPLKVGDFCKLNSGSPCCLVVAARASELTITFRAVSKDGTDDIEWTLPRACVRRTAAPPPDTNDRAVEATL